MGYLTRLILDNAPRLRKRHRHVYFNLVTDTQTPEEVAGAEGSYTGSFLASLVVAEKPKRGGRRREAVAA